MREILTTSSGPAAAAGPTVLAFALLGSCLAACSGETAAGAPAAAPTTPLEPDRLRARVVAVHPHEERSYTQGLEWWKGRMYESRGRHGESGVHSYELETGKVIDDHELEPDLFGEGLTAVGDELVQITWQAGVAIVYDESLNELRRMRFRGEGWGLAYDGESLILSDGTNVLAFLDPQTLNVRRRVEVRQGTVPRDRLNELEWVDGALWANVYQSEELVRIDPVTGRVTAVVEAEGLLDRSTAPRAEVLNGIAYLPERETFLLTGKYWPTSFEVVFEPTG
ncbi:MAG TPA: glutaminyl-peptide cyclotransferase [Thermoanaerobaculia bacterium]|nr:glutaminyl-peptide cyclotransferase [Thermoanaerobaculia bacterium]